MRPRPSATGRALGLALLLAALTFSPTVQAERLERDYDLSFGAGVGDAVLLLAADCHTTVPEGLCRAHEKFLGPTPRLGGIELPTGPVLGKRLHVGATDALASLAPIALGIDVDGDGCVGCTDLDILHAGCGTTEGIVVHSTRGETVALFVATLWTEPTSGAICLATQGTIRVTW